MRSRASGSRTGQSVDYAPHVVFQRRLEETRNVHRLSRVQRNPPYVDLLDQREQTQPSLASG